jgi:hypothetical protein
MVTKLRLARVQTGMNIRDFARWLNLSESLLSKMETGKHYVPEKWRNILADALELNVQDICDEKGWPISSDVSQSSIKTSEFSSSDSLTVHSSAALQCDLHGLNSSSRSPIRSCPESGTRPLTFRRG